MSISKQDFKIIYKKIINSSQDNINSLINNIKSNGLTNDNVINELINKYGKNSIHDLISNIDNKLNEVNSDTSVSYHSNNFNNMVSNLIDKLNYKIKLLNEKELLLNEREKNISTNISTNETNNQILNILDLETSDNATSDTLSIFGIKL
jgi:hypothetical protein